MNLGDFQEIEPIYNLEFDDFWKPQNLKSELQNVSSKYIVAKENGEIVGFGDMDETGYLDRLYVHKDYQGQGVASAICDELERFAAGKTITTHASITAKPFFLHRGYRVVRKQEVIRRGVALTNLVMEKRSERTR